MADELSDNDIFDSIVSGKSAPEQQQQEPVQPTPQSRDDGGRFAAPAAQPAATITPTESQTPGNETQPNAGNVPVGAVQDERQKRQAAQQHASDLEKQLAVMQGQIALLTQQRQPTPQQPQQEKQPASLWDDPDAFLKNQLTPFQQQMQEMREELWESRAAAVHTPEAVQAAKAAAEKVFGTPEGKALHQQITSAGGNPFDNLVKWHKQQETLAKVGGDPEAWLNAEIEKRLADPAEQAKIMERIRAGATLNPNGRPSPVTQLPPSLSRIPSGGNAPIQQGDVSDAEMFSSVTSGRRG